MMYENRNFTGHKAVSVKDIDQHVGKTSSEKLLICGKTCPANILRITSSHFRSTVSPFLLNITQL